MTWTDAAPDHVRQFVETTLARSSPASRSGRHLRVVATSTVLRAGAYPEFQSWQFVEYYLLRL
jgi:hypothetical protein